MDPNFCRNIKELFIMGGNIEGELCCHGHIHTTVLWNYTNTITLKACGVWLSHSVPPIKLCCHVHIHTTVLWNYTNTITLKACGIWLSHSVPPIKLCCHGHIHTNVLWNYTNTITLKACGVWLSHSGPHPYLRVKERIQLYLYCLSLYLHERLQSEFNPYYL